MLSMRAQGLALLKSLAGFDIPAWRMVQMVRNLGYGYRYQTMLSDIRELTGRFKFETRIRDLKSNDIMPEAWMNEVEFEVPFRYKAWFDVTYYNPETGKYVTDVRSVGFDEYMKKTDYEGFAQGRLQDVGCRCDLEFVNIELRGLDKNLRLG